MKHNHNLNELKTQITYAWATAIIALMVINQSAAEACDTELYTVTYVVGVPILTRVTNL